MLGRRRLMVSVLLPLLGAFVGPQSVSAANASAASGGRAFQEDQRINGLTLQFGIDAFATHNALGGALANGLGPSLQSATGASITSGSTSLIFEMLGLTAYFTFTTDRVIVPPPPRIALTPRSGPQGTALRVDGISFVAGQTVKVKYKTGLASQPTVALCRAAVQPNGSFTCSGSVPTTLSGATGPHVIMANEMPSAITAKATFTLTA
jgi:hypothetical protein